MRQQICRRRGGPLSARARRPSGPALASGGGRRVPAPPGRPAGAPLLSPPGGSGRAGPKAAAGSARGLAARRRADSAARLTGVRTKGDFPSARRQGSPGSSSSESEKCQCEVEGNPDRPSLPDLGVSPPTWTWPGGVRVRPDLRNVWDFWGGKAEFSLHPWEANAAVRMS